MKTDETEEKRKIWNMAQEAVNNPAKEPQEIIWPGIGACQDEFIDTINKHSVGLSLMFNQRFRRMLESTEVKNCVHEIIDWETGEHKVYLVEYMIAGIQYKTEEERQEKRRKAFVKFAEAIKTLLDYNLIGYGSLCKFSYMQVQSVDEAGNWLFDKDRFEKTPSGIAKMQGLAAEQVGELTHREIFFWFPVWVARNLRNKAKQHGNAVVGYKIFHNEGELPDFNFV
jgi:hypothetical protein